MQNITTLSVERSGAEMPLFIIAVILSLLVWVPIVISIIGIFYVALFGLILLIGHFAAVTYIRGSGVKVTSEQFPELYHAVENISQRLGFKKIPEVYITQGNGVLNAMATKLLCTKFIVIYSNLVEACEKDPQARNMIVGHELGHLRAGHLRWSWLIWPSYFLPFFGNALSRAREYTADRYGAACCDNSRDAINGLLILAGGKNLASQIKLETFTQQIKNINTGMMRVGEWLHSHPALVRRVCALEPSLNTDTRTNARNSFIKGILIVILSIALGAVVVGGIAAAVVFIPKHQRVQNTEPTTAQTDLSDEQLGLHS